MITFELYEFAIEVCKAVIRAQLQELTEAEFRTEFFGRLGVGVDTAGNLRKNNK